MIVIKADEGKKEKERQDAKWILSPLSYSNVGRPGSLEA